MANTEIARLRSLPDILAEYDEKLAAIPAAIANFDAAGNALKTAACIAGTWGRTTIETGRACERTLKESLLKSAWHHVFDGLNIVTLATAKDKKRFEQDMEKPAPFTLDNIRATFGDYLLNPRANILRGMAEVFSDLDPAFKSHDKVKIGVTGLPKRNAHQIAVRSGPPCYPEVAYPTPDARRPRWPHGRSDRSPSTRSPSCADCIS